ncbi:MAG TPA: RNase adapter RapZ [Candidatus Limnocylindria bacterium]|nr:RNase adapter RapZ [Candidatus Limnocylindria bacterium]
MSRAPVPPPPSATAPELIVITGLSGSGKSQAAKIVEDLGYYTLDNLPPALMPTALEVARKGGHRKVAFVVDARSGPLFAEATAALDSLAREGLEPHLLFFDASDEVLLRRYSETRHRHPLEGGAGVQPSIVEERRVLTDMRARADKVIDTTYLSVKDLRDTLHALYGEGRVGMLVRVTSFGYKYGLPLGADLVFDCRFMENPFYIDELRPLPGSDPKVRSFVLGHPATGEFLDRVEAFLRFAVPRYDTERKAHLGIAFGCTGGRHRSVVVAEEVARRVASFWPGPTDVQHRDVERPDPRT